MAFTDNDLKNEIKAMLEVQIREGDEIIPEWVALKIIRQHVTEFVRQDDFVANAIWGHVRRAVGNEARFFKGQTDGEAGQASLPGFELIQEYYECKRQEGNTETLTRIHREKMSLAELRAEADSLIKVGETFKKHGEQLHRWVDKRIADGLLEE
jgi:hypothetical protein